MVITKVFIWTTQNQLEPCPWAIIVHDIEHVTNNFGEWIYTSVISDDIIIIIITIRWPIVTIHNIPQTPLRYY